MTAISKKLRIDEIEQVVRGFLVSCPQYADLDERIKEKVILGTTMRKTKARCMAYIPGQRPEDGTIIAVFEVDRQTGDTCEVDRSAW